jgi:hypothetical protein
MAMVHYLFLGHFECEGEMARFGKSGNERAFKPVFARSLDVNVVQTALQEVKGAEADGLSFPSDWLVWLGDGYLVADKYTRNADAIDFIARLVIRTGCNICDVASHRTIALQDWLTVVGHESRSAQKAPSLG